MTDRFDRLIGDTIRDLARDADVISDRDRRRLALHASDRAHTLRRRRWGTSAVAVVMVAALAAGIPYGINLLGGGPDRGPTTLPSGVPVAPPGVETTIIDDASKPIELVDGWYVGGNRAVLDQATSLYTPFHAKTVIPSPNGRWVATDSGDGLGLRILDLTDASGRRYETRQLGQRLNSGVWSPDGNTLLVTGMIMRASSIGVDNPLIISAAFIDPVTKNVRIREIPLPDLGCVYCVLTWMPSGSEIALVLSGEEGPLGAPATGIQTFDLDGRPVRTLPVAGVPAGTGSWSPDGRSVIVTSNEVTSFGSATNRAQIIDVSTGAVVQSLDGLDLKQAQWVDNERFLAWEPIVTGAETNAIFRGMVSLWTRDGVLLQRWIPPIEVVELDPGPVSGVLTVRLD
jgi:hypothetical protein